MTSLEFAKIVEVDCPKYLTKEGIQKLEEKKETKTRKKLKK